jgi:hypothetical protein
MTILQKIRLGAAIVLICAIFLPLSQCSRSGDKNDSWSPRAFAHSRHFFPQDGDGFEYQYAVKNLTAGFTNPKEYGVSLLLTLTAFLWPLGFAIWSRKSKLSRFWWIFYSAELLLCAGTGYSVYALALGRGVRWLYGFYVAEGAVAIYAGTALILIANRLRNYFRSRRS